MADELGKVLITELVDLNTNNRTDELQLKDQLPLYHVNTINNPSGTYKTTFNEIKKLILDPNRKEKNEKGEVITEGGISFSDIQGKISNNQIDAPSLSSLITITTDNLANSFVLPTSKGGTGVTTGVAPKAGQLNKSTNFITNLSSTNAVTYNGTQSTVSHGVMGILPVEYGGTGSSTGAISIASEATKLETARTIRANLASTNEASFDGTANITPGVTGVLPIANGGTGNSTGTATTANYAKSAAQLTTARTIRTNLASASTASFNGTANITPGVTGILPIANGGTGASDRLTAFKNLTNQNVASPNYVASLTTSWASAGYTSLQNLRKAMGLGDSTGVLPVANGGTGASAQVLWSWVGNGSSNMKTNASKAITVTGGKLLLIYGIPGTTSRSFFAFPPYQLSSTPTSFQVADQTNYITFTLARSSNTVTLKVTSMSSAQTNSGITNIYVMS